MVELKDMSLIELEAHKTEVEKLIKQHHDARKAELVDGVLLAVQKLLAEYPHSSCDIEVTCPDCDVCFDVDILEYLSKSHAGEFSVW